MTLTQFTLNYPTEFCPHGFQKSLFFLAKKKKEIFVREGEWGGSKGTSGIYTIHAKLFNSVLSKRFSKISFIYQKKKDFWKVEEGSGFCSGTHNNHAMYSTAHCPQDLRHLFFFCTKKEKIFLEQRLCCFVSNI